MTLFAKSIVIRPSSPGDTYQQTKDVYNQAAKYFPEVVRMWAFINKIDNNYREFSLARNEVYEANGIDNTSRSFVSTGVGTDKRVPGDNLILKLLLIPGVRAEQIEYMDLFTHLPHTSSYNVSFERGSVVTFKNCKHYYISGTASIDPKGKVLYPDDISKQTQRAYEVIKALLEKYGASHQDIISMKWYVRNKAHIYNVKNELIDLGLINDFIKIDFEKANICRKSWLVEAECFAFTNDGDDQFDEFSFDDQ